MQSFMQLAAKPVFVRHESQLVSLARFCAPPSPSRLYHARGAPQVAHARKGKNIFLDPKPADQSLTALYGSGRFSDDDDFHQPEPQQPQQPHQGTTASATAAASPTPAAVASGDVPLPPPKHVRVLTAEFIKSSVTVEQCPPERFPEFAIIGRSNVGKSSLINTLTGRSSLALVSKTPGKTRCINHFLINDSWYLVDLPGYGYAKTSKENILGWNTFTRDFFQRRASLVAVLLLVDASIPPMPLDLACADWFGEHQIPFTLVFTKIDKRKKGCPPPEENAAAFESALRATWGELPPALATSSRSGAGKKELLAHVAQLRQLWAQAQAAAGAQG